MTTNGWTFDNSSLEKKINEQDTQKVKKSFDKVKDFFSKSNMEKISKQIKHTKDTFWKKKFSYQYYKDWELRIGSWYAKDIQELKDTLRWVWISAIQNIVEEKLEWWIVDVEWIKESMSKVKVSDLRSLVSSISTLLRWWASATEAIKETIQNIDNANLRKVVEKVLEKSRLSRELHKAFEWFPKYFDKNFIFLVKAWDKSWNYAKAFTELAEQIKMSDDIEKLKKEARSEPLKNIAALAIAMVVILWNVVPWISSMFTWTWQDLPIPTVILLWVTAFFENYLTLFIIWVIALWILLKNLLSNKVTKKIFDEMSLKIPVIREKVKFENFYNMANTFDILWRSWWESTLSCLKDLKWNTKNTVFKESIDKSIEATLRWDEFPIWDTVEKDKQLWKTRDYILYPMLKNWEKNSNIEKILSDEKLELFKKYKEYTELYIWWIKAIFWWTIKWIILFVVVAIFLPLITYDPNASGWWDTKITVEE